MSKYTMPPRQKMINLIYIILIAMLGINVSQDVLEGYDLMGNDYQPQVIQLQKHNAQLRMLLENKKPELKPVSQALLKQTEELKQQLDKLEEDIARMADQDKYQPGALINRSDPNATPHVMINNGHGKELKALLKEYKEKANSLLEKEEQRNLMNSFLVIGSSQEEAAWEHKTFTHLTANAGIALLKKMQKELLTCERELLQTLIDDKHSFETAKLATDTTVENQVWVNGVLTEVAPNGTLSTPLVQVAPQGASILYKGYENRLSFSSIGVRKQELKLAMENGKILVDNGQYLAIPDNSAQRATLLVSCNNQLLSRFDYIVKPLPDPIPYVTYTYQGKQALYKANTPISKSQVLSMKKIVAIAPEGPAMTYHVLSFETVFIRTEKNEVTTLKNKGHEFSNEQIRMMEQLQPGDKFYITSITVSGSKKNQEQIASINIVLI